MHVSSSSGEIAQQIANQPGELRESVVDLLNITGRHKRCFDVNQSQHYRQNQKFKHILGEFPAITGSRRRRVRLKREL